MEYRIFSLRLPHALAERLGRAKAVFGSGELSTGETARRLLEQRLDQLERHAARRTARQTLRDLRATWPGAPAWTPAQWHCLAAYATQAYAHALRHGRSVVDRPLLLALWQGVEALGARSQRRPPAPQEAPEQVLRPAGGGPSGTADTPGWGTAGAVVPPVPTPEMGYAVCRQLAAVVREASGRALAPCQAGWAPFLAALLQLALRGYWYTAGASILDTPGVEEVPACFPLTDISTAAGRCVPHVAGHRLSLVLALTTPSLEVAVRTYVDWLDLVMLVESAQATGEEVGTVRTPLGTLTWAAPDHGSRMYQLTLGQVRLTLRLEDFRGLVALLQAVQAQPALRSYLVQLAYVYGRI